MIIDWSGQHLYVGGWNAWPYNPYGVEEGIYVPAVLLYNGHIYGLQTPNVNQPGYPQYVWFGINPENLGVDIKPNIHNGNWVSDGGDHQGAPFIFGAYNTITSVNKQGNSPTVIKRSSRPDIVKK